MNKIELHRVAGDFGFDATDENGNIVTIDGAESIGGQGYGSRPMQLILMGLGGCSGIDIVAILKKQRQVVTGVNIKIEGEREKDKIPSLWKSVNIIFELSGDIDENKAQRACALSMDKHCSVAETLRLGGTEIKWTCIIKKNS
ncbi:MAG: OsmC family protein [Bacteroidetes bacterium]|nr:OsmC family protein [Bacteroidota bacterium]MBS1758134.1 OsmC family protein [Bacteroidota bacterium]